VDQDQKERTALSAMLIQKEGGAALISCLETAEMGKIPLKVTASQGSAA